MFVYTAKREKKITQIKLFIVASENPQTFIFPKNFPTVSSDQSLALNRYDNAFCRSSVGRGELFKAAGEIRDGGSCIR